MKCSEIMQNSDRVGELLREVTQREQRAFS
jgi:hypothetical protein